MEPKIYSLEDHLIPHDKIDSHAYYTIEKLRSEGFSAYLVGGSVRDLILHQRPKDFDVSTSAKPEEIKRIFRRNSILIGRRFRLAHVRFGQKIIEVSTFRSGDTEESTLIIKDNIWGTAEEDAMRRDFTINALYYDPETQRIIDYVGGFEDAKAKLLKTIGIPEVRFKQDPVRMIRLLKFRARFGFLIEKETEKALISCKDELLKSSQARILEELQRMLESGASEPFFRMMSEYGFLHLLMPYLAKEIDDHKRHVIYDYLKQADSTMVKHFREGLSRPVLLACLIFPIMEKRVKKLVDKREYFPHLGTIAEEAQDLIDGCFFPFFHISRKLKAELTSILTNQYRLIPFDEKKKTLRKKIPRDEFFPLALEFLKIRAELFPDLLVTYTQWNETLVNFHSREEKKESPVRKRRRRRPPFETPPPS